MKLLTGALLLVPLVLALVGSAGLADKIVPASPRRWTGPAVAAVSAASEVLALLFVVPLLGVVRGVPADARQRARRPAPPRRPEPAVPRVGKAPLQVES